MPKILIIRFSSIGDIVLTSPVIRNVKNQIPDCELHYCTKASFRNILENNPYLAKIHTYDNDLNVLVKALKDEKFDYVLDLHNNLRTRIIKFKLDVKSYTFNKLNLRKWLLVNLKIDVMPKIHIVDRYLATARGLGVTNDGLGLDYFVPAKDEIAKTDLPQPFRIKYAAFAIGAQHFTKRLPEDKIIAFCKQIPLPIILLGGKEDIEVGENVTSAINDPNKILNFCGKVNLNQSASLTKNAEIVLVNDTGMMHIAAAMKKRVVSLWGNTTPLFGMYPYKTDTLIVENNYLSCRPCSKIGYSKCPQGHFKCMKELNLPEISGI